MPALVALPGSTAEVQAVVRICDARGRAVRRARRRHRALGRRAAGRRGDRDLARAAEPRSSRSTSSRSGSSSSPASTNLDVTRAVAADGFYYAPDPSSQQVCTIGGNVAENSGGAHCLKYGFTVNHVLAARRSCCPTASSSSSAARRSTRRARPARRLRRLRGHARDRDRDHAAHPARAGDGAHAARRRSTSTDAAGEAVSGIDRAPGSCPPRSR